MSIRVSGIGAVSPAGWGLEPFIRAMESTDDQPVEAQGRGPGTLGCRYRMVANPVTKSPLLAHPRLRRAPRMAKFTAAAAGEACLGREGEKVGVIFVAMNGSVSYSRRFFQGALEDPATASPLLFPETVYNSMASHVSAVMNWTGPNHTLVGDSAGFGQGLDVAAQWLEDGLADAVVVVSAEECDWVCAEALEVFQPGAISAEGAGAVCLEKGASGVFLEAVTRAVAYSERVSRETAARRVRDEFRPWSDNAMVVDSLRGQPRNDAAEARAWRDWVEARQSPGTVFGEAYALLGAWQCVAAVEAICSGKADRVLVPMTGTSERALGVVFQRG